MAQTISRLGVTDASTDGSWEQDNNLFLEQFSGEVLTAFDETNVFRDLHLVRTISQGKSASFPATWKASASYHTPGNAVIGSQSIKHNERVIKIDDLLLADVFIYDLDEAKNHYDVRSIYSRELGAALAREFDKKVAQVLTLAARASATISGGDGGSQLTNANFKTSGDVLAGGIFDAAQKLDEKDVPENDRYVAVKPAQYYLLAQTTKILNRDWGGQGAYADGDVLKVAGVSIVKSNNVPDSDLSGTSETGENNDYYGNFSNTAAVVWNRMAAGTVKLMDLTTQMSGEDFNIMYQGTLMVAKYALGHGILRPECAVELATS